MSFVWALICLSFALKILLLAAGKKIPKTKDRKISSALVEYLGKRMVSNLLTRQAARTSSVDCIEEAAVGKFAFVVTTNYRRLDLKS